MSDSDFANQHTLANVNDGCFVSGCCQASVQQPSSQGDIVPQHVQVLRQENCFPFAVTLLAFVYPQ